MLGTEGESVCPAASFLVHCPHTNNVGTLWLQVFDAEARFVPGCLLEDSHPTRLAYLREAVVRWTLFL